MRQHGSELPDVGLMYGADIDGSHLTTITHSISRHPRGETPGPGGVAEMAGPIADFVGHLMSQQGVDGVVNGYI